MTAHYTHIGIETAKRAVAALPDVTRAEENGATGASVATGAKLEGVLAALEVMGRGELARVGERLREMLGR
ncbi:MAG: hypothetical protein PHG96_06425 [Kiritimatiellae bacterium]|nr:hypothetical protein [Kiritimatiellia bacterium]MDD4024752.1 hypothetical protein [Kiritimatiellia bacterium]MDD4622944.1 hypothetical protein [Kiritimatiellia bacterium]